MTEEKQQFMPEATGAFYSNVSFGKAECWSLVQQKLWYHPLLSALHECESFAIIFPFSMNRLRFMRLMDMRVQPVNRELILFQLNPVLRMLLPASPLPILDSVPLVVFAFKEMLMMKHVKWI